MDERRKGKKINVLTGSSSCSKTIDETTNDNSATSPFQSDELQHCTYTSMAVLAVGSSAMDISALQQFFTDIPADSSICFITLLHPAECVDLPKIVNSATTIPVELGKDGTLLRGNTVFIIPCDKTMVINNGRLYEQPPHSVSIQHPVNSLLFSLASEATDRAIAVILSGPRRDGIEGISAVKRAGGLVLVQEPKTAAQPDMPLAAIATGTVDLILPAETIGNRILEVARRYSNLELLTGQAVELDEQLRELFRIVRNRTGHDFSSYKQTTVLRRIERRMAVHGLKHLSGYLELLRENHEEAHALGQEFLIGVTSFFRDPEAFDTLKSVVIPSILANRDPEDTVRIWHPCCATGEEVYSTAMLIKEHLAEHQLDCKVLIFATDIDESAITVARTGVYSDAIETVVSDKRRQAFFTKTGSQYQVAKSLREMIVFAQHNLIRDPPFSRLDLLVCRNFLIYLNTDMQLRLLALFHQVLKPGGFLFCGSSETVDRHANQFVAINKKWKIFTRSFDGQQRPSLMPPAYPPKMPIADRHVRYLPAEKANTAGCVEKILLERYSPPCVVVNEKFEVVHVSTRTNLFLELPVGEPTRDILKMAHSNLRPALRAAIHKALTEQKQITYRGVSIADGESSTKITVVAEPLNNMSSPDKLIMVVLKPSTPTENALSSPSTITDSLPGDESAKDALIRQLEEQLRVTQEQLLTTIEQLESSNEGLVSVNEELMSTNEEFQATNEELQSTNEELETSREELQSLNEELVTVNTELHGKVEELNRANSDMENFLISSDIATIFLDRSFNIMRFTPAICSIFNIIPSDVGRPFRHLANTIDWQSFADLAQSVLLEAVPLERELANLGNGHCHIMRILPYRTTSGDIDGIVVTFIDISERKLAEDNLRLAKEHWERTFNSVPDLIAILDNQHRVVQVNRAMAEKLGKSPQECVGLPCYAAVHCTEEPPAFCPHSRTVADGEEHGAEVREERLGGDYFVTTTPLTNTDGIMSGAVHVARNITERKLSEEALRESKELLRRLTDHLPCYVASIDSNERYRFVNETYRSWFGRNPDDILGLTVEELVGPENYTNIKPHINNVLAGNTVNFDYLMLLPDNNRRYVNATYVPDRDHDGSIRGFYATVIDLTERQRAKEILRESEERFRGMFENHKAVMLLIDPESGSIIDANNAAAGYYGYSLDELRTFNISKINKMPPDELIAMRQSIVAGKCNCFTAPHLLANSETRLVEVYSSPIITEGKVLLFSINHDVTERRLTEEALRQSEERYRTLVHFSPIGMFINRNNQIDWVNPAAQQLFGAQEPDELFTRSPFELFHPDFHSLMRLRIAELLKGNPLGMIVEKIIRLDGEERDVEVVAVPFTDSKGQAILVMLNDITERVQTERERELTVQFLRLVNECRNRTDMVRSAASFIQQNSGCESVGIRLRSGKSYPYLEVHGQDSALTLRENDICAGADIVGSSCLCGCIISGKLTADSSCITKQGTFSTNCVSNLLDHQTNGSIQPQSDKTCNWQQYESVTMVPLCTGEERFGLLQLSDHQRNFFSPATIALWEHLAGHLAVALEKFRVEEELKESEERWQFAIEGSNDGVWDRNIQTGEIFFSKKWKEMLGYSGDEIGNSAAEWLKRVHAEDLPQVRREIGRHLANEVPLYSAEYRMQCKDGFYKWILARGKVTSRTEDGKPLRFIGTHSDITERKNLEEQLYQSQKMEAVGQLAGGIAHDFNNILTAIIGYSHLISMNTDQAPSGSPLRSYVEQIHSSAERAAELTQALLAFSRKQVMVPKVLSLSKTVIQLEKMLRRLISENIELKLDLSPGDLNVMADKSKIEQMLLNLVTNAKDAMSGNGVLSITTSLTAMNEKTIARQGFGRVGTYACITVSDTGCGIEEETRKKIFEPFFTTKEIGKGTGLGLSIVYGIVKQHNGYIDVSSKLGKGTTFSIFLPAVKKKTSEPVAETKMPTSGGHETILLAEDDPAVRSFHKTLFEKAGYTVIAAADGKDALEAFTRHEAEIDLLVLDVVMPKINGIQLHDLICKKKPDIKALFLSGYTADILKEVGGTRKMENILNKPVVPGELLTKIRQVLIDEET